MQYIVVLHPNFMVKTAEYISVVCATFENPFGKSPHDGPDKGGDDRPGDHFLQKAQPAQLQKENQQKMTTLVPKNWCA